MQLEPDKKMTVTLVLPTMYLHNRVGKCKIQLTPRASSRNESAETTEINFNTTINAQALAEFMIRRNKFA